MRRQEKLCGPQQSPNSLRAALPGPWRLYLQVSSNYTKDTDNSKLAQGRSFDRVLSYLIANLCVDPVDILVDEPDQLPGELLAELWDEGGPALLYELRGSVRLAHQSSHRLPVSTPSLIKGIVLRYESFYLMICFPSPSDYYIMFNNLFIYNNTVPVPNYNYCICVWKCKTWINDTGEKALNHRREKTRPKLERRQEGN